MTKYITTAEGLATTVGVAILAASTNANVLNTGGWLSSHALLVAALSLGVFAGARVVGMGAGKIGLVIIAALIAGEAFNFSATAERIVVEREASAAPLKAQREAHDAAERRQSEVSAAPVRSARLDMAVAAQTKAQAAYQLELRTGGRCKSICNGLKADAAKADAEVTAAATEAQKLHAAAIEAAKAEVEANPLPASATPLADRLGWPAWVLDLVMAGLLSVGANGLAGTLIAYGAHSTGQTSGQNEKISKPSQSFNPAIFPDNSQTDFDPTYADNIIRFYRPDNEPTPPPPGKKRGRKKDPKVVDFVQRFRQANGRNPRIPEMRAQFPQLDKATLWRNAQSA